MKRAGKGQRSAPLLLPASTERLPSAPPGPLSSKDIELLEGASHSQESGPVDPHHRIQRLRGRHSGVSTAVMPGGGGAGGGGGGPSGGNNAALAAVIIVGNQQQQQVAVPSGGGGSGATAPGAATGIGGGVSCFLAMGWATAWMSSVVLEV